MFKGLIRSSSGIAFKASRNVLLQGTPAMGGSRLLNVHEYVRDIY
jgi:hypothetical protein